MTGTFVGVDFEDEHLTIGLADCGDLTLSFSQVRMLRPCPRDAGIATDDCKSVLDDWTEPEEDVE